MASHRYGYYPAFIIDLATNRCTRRKGSRLLGIALFVAVALLYSGHSVFPRSPWSSSSFWGYTKPVASLEQRSTSSSTEVPPYVPPPSPLVDETSASPPRQWPMVILSPQDRPSCPIVKVSMLYGAYNFPQLQAALESHHRHCERWGCDFVFLEEDLSSRKLYSKPYFLLSTLLHELSKPAGERKEWLM